MSDAPPSSSPSKIGSFLRNRWVLRVVKLVVLLAVVWFGHRTLRQGLDDLEKNSWHWDQIEARWLVISGVLYIVSQVFIALFWDATMHMLGQRPKLSTAISAFLIGHLGKYVPGKALVVVFRSALVRSDTVKVAPAAIAVFYETFTTMAIGSLLAAGIVASIVSNSWRIVLIALALAALNLTPLIPAVFDKLIGLTKVGRSQEVREHPVVMHLQLGLLVPAWISVVIGWIVTGASLWAVLYGMHAVDSLTAYDLALSTAAVAIAIVAGFVSMLPGGFGVREVALASLLAPAYGDRTAIVSVVLLRLIWLASEVAITVLLFGLGALIRLIRGDTRTNSGPDGRT